MKKTFLLLFIVLLTLSAHSQNTLRLMTYNIKNANGMDYVCNFQRVANVINNACPDVVAVQEVDSVTNRSNQKYVLGEIAERTQMHAFFAPANRLRWREIRHRLTDQTDSHPCTIHLFTRTGRRTRTGYGRI